jgi:hypothetical protein
MTEMLLGTPIMISSSSRDAEAVLPARRALFQSLVVGASDRLAAQDAFHRHRWAERPGASVDMRRHDAATHSITTVDISADGVAMRYEPQRQVVGDPAWLSLPRHRVAAAPLAMVS